MLGAPGAGKGTLAQQLVAEFGVAHISTGDLLRAAVKGGTELGVQAKKYMDAGELVPDQLVIDLVKERLAADDAQKGFILDGFPRNTMQAVTLDSELSGLHRELDCALLVDVASDVIIGRLSARRACRDCGYTGTAADETCPKCGGKILKKTSKRGYAYYGCENNSNKDEAKRCDFMTWDVPVKETCPECGHTLFKKSGRGFKKPFCINPECPNFLPEDQRGYKKKAASAESPAEGAPPEEEKKPAQKAAAKKTAAKKPAAKTAAAKKTAAPKKTAAKKPAAKKAAAKTKSEA